MSYIGRVLAHIPKRAYRLHRFYLYWRAEERMIRQYPAERLRALQWRRFAELLEFAYNRIPFYRDRFRQARITPESIRSRDDLIRIPILSKDDIRQNFPDRLLDSSRTYDPSRIAQTSGSTAESLHFVRPQESWRRSLYYSVYLRTRRIRNLPVLVLATPYCTASTCALEDNEDSQEYISKLHTIRFLRHLDRMIGLPSSENILSASDEYMQRLARMVSFYAPCLLVADPVYLGAFARFLRRSGQRIPGITDIITTYELLTGSLKDLLHEVFEADVYTQYGSSEINDVANECERHKLHVRSSNVLVEAIRDGQPVGPGEIGKAVLTDLCNYSMPFIRYDIGDVVMSGNGRCGCGRNTETIEAVHGRVCDVLATNGAAGRRLLTPLQVDEAFRGLGGIAFYRLVQQATNLYDLAIMPDAASGELDRRTLIERCRSVLGPEAQVNIETVDEVRPLASMKFRPVYSAASPGDL